MNPSPAVCILIENLTVPIDRRVWQEARTLRGAGYTVSIVCPTGAGFEKRYERMEEIDVYRYRLPWEGDGPLGYLLEYGWALAATLRLALKAYRKTRFRVLHACNPPDLFFSSAWSSSSSACATCSTITTCARNSTSPRKGRRGVFIPSSALPSAARLPWPTR